MICGHCGKKVSLTGETYFAALMAGGFQAYCDTSCGDKQIKESTAVMKTTPVKETTKKKRTKK